MAFGSHKHTHDAPVDTTTYSAGTLSFLLPLPLLSFPLLRHPLAFPDARFARLIAIWLFAAGVRVDMGDSADKSDDL